MSASGRTVLAVDLGATSGRVAAVTFDQRPPTVRVLYRFPVADYVDPQGSVRWNLAHMLRHIRHGVGLGLQDGPASSLAFDSWGVDYGLISASGQLIGDPHAYRSTRTAAWQQIAHRLGRRRLFDETGVLPQNFNSIFQLAVHDRREVSEASAVLLFTNLLEFCFTGFVGTERSLAGVSGMLELHGDDWAWQIVREAGIESRLLTTIFDAPRVIGDFLGTPIISIAGHDTAGAIMIAAPQASEHAFISSGSTLVVGMRTDVPICTNKVFAAGLSNEPVADGRYALVKNIPGLRLLELCSRELGFADVRDATAAAAIADEVGQVIDVEADSLFETPRISDAVRLLAKMPDHVLPGSVIRILTRSLVTAVGNALDSLEICKGIPINTVRIVGGGVRNGLFMEMLRDSCRRRVEIGPQEAAAIGNATQQAVAHGWFCSVEDALGI